MVAVVRDERVPDVGAVDGGVCCADDEHQSGEGEKRGPLVMDALVIVPRDGPEDPTP